MKQIFTLYILNLFFCFCNGQTINPSQFKITERLLTTITSPNTFQYISSSPQIQSVIFSNPDFQFTAAQSGAFTHVTHDSIKFYAEIPRSAPAGIYDVTVNDNNWSSHFFPSMCTILPPDGYAEGRVFYDRNRNGIMDSNEDGVPNEMIHIWPETFSTDSTGKYIVPAINDSLFIQYWPSNFNGQYFHMKRLTTGINIYHILINNDTVSNLDFGFADALYNMSVTSGSIGQTNVTALVYSDSLFQAQGQPFTFNYGRLKAGYHTIQIDSSSIFVLTPSLARIRFNIPANAACTLYDLELFSNSTLYQQQDAFLVTAGSYLSGKLFYDWNQNGLKDSMEAGISNRKVTSQPDSVIAFTNHHGDFMFGLNSGTHVFSPDTTGGFVTSTPASVQITNTGNVTGIDFGLFLNTPDYYGEIHLVPGLQRCNSNATNRIIYRNYSNQVYSGIIRVQFSNNASYISSSPAAMVNGNMLEWTFSSLQPFESRELSFNLILPGWGSNVDYFFSMIVSDSMGNVVFSTEKNKTFFVVCAYDPNDKSVYPSGYDDQMRYVYFTDTLEYLIRFQNTGNDTAFNVFIRDTIDSALDLNTLELIATSHPARVEINNDRVLTFYFDNILLPDSNIDEPNSHGYVMYRIRQTGGLAGPTRCENTAYIFFDQNAPVITNTVWNTLVRDYIVLETPDIQNGEKVSVFPNPLTSASEISFMNNTGENFKLEIFDVTGKCIYKDQTSANRFIICRTHFTDSGVYLYKMVNTETGKTFYGKLSVIN